SASSLKAGETLSVTAGGDIVLQTQNEQHNAERMHTSIKRKVASTTVEKRIDGYEQGLAIGSMLSGNTVAVKGNNVTVSGSAVVADNTLRLDAAQNLNIVAAEQQQSEFHLQEKTKSGLMSSGGIGFTVGKSMQRTTAQAQGVTHAASTVGSIGGDVTLNAGKQLNVDSSDLVAANNLELSGAQVNVRALHDQFSQQQVTETRTSGLTIGLSGSVGSALNSAVQAAQAARQEDDNRLQALQGTKAALHGAQALQAYRLDNAQQGTPDASNASIGVSASYGSQSSKRTDISGQQVSQSSGLTAGNNLSIRARGDNGEAGDITISGSQLKAGGDVNLSAERDVNLQSAQDSQYLRSENKSQGGSVGVGITVGNGSAGISFSASANMSKGHERGNGTSHNETTVTAGNQLSISSGRDTSLTGAQASGDSVKLDVGRNLSLKSEQDSDQYDSKQQSLSVSGSFTYGSMSVSGQLDASQEKMHSDYQSVREQTGIQAGKGGYDIQVGAHTQLDGAVIASEAEAEKNRLDTGTLGFSNIENRAAYDVEQQQISISANAVNDLINLANSALGAMNRSDSDNGTTQAAISAGTLTVRDN
ncbi:hemagglutinin repeat-containing protein, partial [Serratia microhaemolytica]|uniref:hemagglutinin repeat-containing protein n=2 Tax=Serratia microhaemolytica TaxID=2675110 RepID=UPI0019826DCA